MRDGKILALMILAQGLVGIVGGIVSLWILRRRP